MLNGKKIAWDPKLAARIVDLRLAGIKWKDIDGLVFPGEKHKDQRCGSFAGDFCIKHRKEHPEVEGAFTKMLIGGFSATQIVVKLRDTVVPMKSPVHQGVTMADLGLHEAAA